MRCKACNTILEEFEVARKEKATGEFIELCSHCFHQSNMAKYSDDDTLQAYTDYAMEPSYTLQVVLFAESCIIYIQRESFLFYF